jgi:hypothetical protein
VEEVGFLGAAVDAAHVVRAAVAADVPEAAVPPVAAAVAELVAEPAGELLAAPPQPARASPAARNISRSAVRGQFHAVL